MSGGWVPTNPLAYGTWNTTGYDLQEDSTHPSRMHSHLMVLFDRPMKLHVATVPVEALNE